MYSEAKSLTKPAIERLARRGGVRRLAGDASQYARELMITFLEEILRRAYLYNDFKDKIKLEPISIVLALRSSPYNIKLVAGLDGTSRGDIRGNIVKMSGGAGDKRKGGGGENILKEIRKLQKTSDLIIPAQSFERLCRQIVEEYIGKDSNKIMFKPNALLILRDALESYIVRTFDVAQRTAIHAKRITTTAEDMKMVQHVRGFKCRF